MSARAELIADGGESASSEEFFRCPEYLATEAVTHTLRIESGDAAIAGPVVVREIPGSDRLDATSPYGYPGFEGAAGDAIDPASIDFTSTELVSVFVRHRLESPPPLTGTTERNVCRIADPAEPRKSRASDRQQIRRNERDGYALRMIAGREVDDPTLDAFHNAYIETMDRTEATPDYYFDRNYFATLLGSERTRLAVVSAPEGDLAAGSLIAESDGILHYYLSGTPDRYLRASPMKTLVSGLVDLAEREEIPLNLGGGLKPGDPLEEFKRGFANRAEAWRTSEIVCDPEAYADLSGDREADGFFPAYRAP